MPEIERDDVGETFLRSYRIVYRVEEGGITVLLSPRGATPREGWASLAN